MIGSVLALFGFAALAAGGAFLAGSRWARTHAAAGLAQSNAELSRRLRELFLLQELTYLLSESLEVERIAEQVARYLVRFLDAHGAMVVLAGPDQGAVQIAAAEGSLGQCAGRTVSLADAGPIAEAMAHEKLELVSGRSPTQLLPGVGTHLAAVAPLRAHGVTTGAIVASDPPGEFGADQLRLLSTVAAHAAVVLTNARLFDQLRAGQQQWESTFDALAAGLAVVDDAGRIRRANRSLAGTLSRPPGELVGGNLARMLLGNDTALAELYQAVARGARVSPFTVRSEPLKRFFRIAAAPMGGDASEGWVVALIEDVTEQKAFEAQMIQHEKMAAMGQLVSGVAHELNNPLTSVSGLAELLLDQQATMPAAKEHLRVIHEQAERAGKIVRNLLSFSRPGPAEIAPLDLGDVVRRTALLLEYEVRLQQVDLETDVPPEPVTVLADRAQLQQVVVILLTNAVQAVASNPPGDPRRVALRAGRSADRVWVEVEDTGPGVPDDLVPQIFTPFFTTKGPGVGTGLGLAIAYGIVQRHGGVLSVSRAASGGARFEINLPASSETAPIAAAPGAGPRPSGTRAGRRILLVDEDPAVGRTISMLFLTDGHAVDMARDAAQGMQLLEREHYDLIIADPGTPAGSGSRFGDELVARWPALRRRTIFATADVRPETEAWLSSLKCRYLHKPLSAGQLRAAAAELLGLRSGG